MGERPLEIIGAIDMEDYQKRVLNEQVDLGLRLDRLTAFMYSDTYAALPSVEQGLIMVQQVAMENYYDTLFRRIELFKDLDESKSLKE